MHVGGKDAGHWLFLATWMSQCQHIARLLTIVVIQLSESIRDEACACAPSAQVQVGSTLTRPNDPQT